MPSLRPQVRQVGQRVKRVIEKRKCSLRHVDAVFEYAECPTVKQSLFSFRFISAANVNRIWLSVTKLIIRTAFWREDRVQVAKRYTMYDAEQAMEVMFRTNAHIAVLSLVLGVN